MGGGFLRQKTKACDGGMPARERMRVYFPLLILWLLPICKRPASSKAKSSEPKRFITHIPSHPLGQAPLLIPFQHRFSWPYVPIFLCLPELAAVGLAVHEPLPRGVGLVDHLLE